MPKRTKIHFCIKCGKRIKGKKKSVWCEDCFLIEYQSQKVGRKTNLKTKMPDEEKEIPEEIEEETSEEEIK